MLPRKIQQQDSQIEQGQQVSEHSQQSQFIKVKFAGRKNLCQMCNNVLAKYTCPKCGIKTCSLNCTRKHKQVKQCKGERDPTEYVSRDEIDQKIVEKDYNFIQQMISSADKVKKVLSGVNNTINLQPRRFKILRNNARQFYNIKLSNGPNILQRHRENISFFFVKTKSIYWVFQLMYFEGGPGNTIKTSQVITQPICDQKTFLQVLPQNYLCKQLLQSKSINTTNRQQFLVFLQNKNRCDQGGQKAGKNVVVSQRIAAGKFTTTFQLIQYDLQRKVCDQMQDIQVFEFPTLYVVHKTMREQFINKYKQVKLTKSNQNQRNLNSERQRSRQKQHQNSRKTKTLKSSRPYNQ